MSYERLAGRLYNTPLLITPEKADVIERVFRAHLEGTAHELPKVDVPARPDVLELAGGGQGGVFMRTRGGYLRNDAGAALIQVVGSLVQRGSNMDAASGLESYDNIAAQLSAAANDPSVRGILLEFDSMGGESNGVAALGDLIRATDQRKPTIAHANEIAFSAAYWLASSASEVMMAKTGMVGSVGVIMLHVDQSRLDEKRGLDVTHITAGARKADFSPHAPLSETALANAQAMVDRMMSHFVAHVAAAREIPEDAVRATEAGLLHPDEALAAGMVDDVGTLDDALARLSVLMNDSSKRKFYGRAAALAQSGQPIGDNTMSDAPKGAAPNAAAITPEQLADARAAGKAEGQTVAAEDAAKAARLAERARISAITSHAEAAGRDKLAAHLAHKTDISVDDAVAMMAAAPKETPPAVGNTFAAAMAGVPNPRVGADAELEQPKITPPNPTTVYAFRRECVLNARRQSGGRAS